MILASSTSSRFSDGACSCSTMIYVAAGLVVAALLAMASGRVDPLLALRSR